MVIETGMCNPDLLSASTSNPIAFDVKHIRSLIIYRDEWMAKAAFEKNKEK